MVSKCLRDNVKTGFQGYYFGEIQEIFDDEEFTIQLVNYVKSFIVFLKKNVTLFFGFCSWNNTFAEYKILNLVILI